jgi:SAM-dependent methyltransferase
MGLVGGELGYRILRRLARGAPSGLMDGSAYHGKSKVEALLGPGFWDRIRDKTVIDFGCGLGDEAVEMAQHGAREVIGLDIVERYLVEARRRAREAGVADRCRFATKTDVRADVIVALDSFEHFADPPAILRLMAGMLRADGRVVASFGPTWYHPLGGHLFSIFPWSHLIFTEGALIRWRADFKTDGARRFGEVEGGLNQMTVRRFVRLVSESPFEFAEFHAIPIRRLAPLANRLTREFTTAIIRCTLALRERDVRTGA